MTKIERLLKKVEDAEAEVLAELKRLYPLKSLVRYRLRAGLDTQTGYVTGHIGGREGRIRILLSVGRHGGDPYETSLPHHKIIGREA